MNPTTGQPCPQPEVYVVPARAIDSLGWMALSGLLLLLWVRSVWQYHKLKPKEVAPGIVLHEGLKPVPPGPEPDAFQEFASALKAMGFKQREIKERWAKVDQSAPIEQQIAQAMRLGVGG